MSLLKAFVCIYSDINLCKGAGYRLMCLNSVDITSKSGYILSILFI